VGRGCLNKRKKKKRGKEKEKGKRKEGKKGKSDGHHPTFLMPVAGDSIFMFVLVCFKTFDCVLLKKVPSLGRVGVWMMTSIMFNNQALIVLAI
jgi:hypothetical protein